MKCPTCSSWTEVRESRTKPGGYVRRRECGNGHRFLTVEVLLQAPKRGRPKQEKP